MEKMGAVKNFYVFIPAAGDTHPFLFFQTVPPASPSPVPGQWLCLPQSIPVDGDVNMETLDMAGGELAAAAKLAAVMPHKTLYNELLAAAAGNTSPLLRGRHNLLANMLELIPRLIGGDVAGNIAALARVAAGIPVSAALAEQGRLEGADVDVSDVDSVVIIIPAIRASSVKVKKYLEAVKRFVDRRVGRRAGLYAVAWSEYESYLREVLGSRIKILTYGMAEDWNIDEIVALGGERRLYVFVRDAPDIVAAALPRDKAAHVAVAVQRIRIGQAGLRVEPVVVVLR